MLTTEEPTRPAAVDGGDRTFMVMLTAWILLQIPRLVAVPLIASVANDDDAPAWMYPAILDVVCAVVAPLLAVALWKWRGLGVWTAVVIYLTVSIVDHVGFFTTYAQIGGPNAFDGMSPPGGEQLVPAIQTVIDAAFLLLVVRRKDLFFEPAQPAP